MAVFTSTSNPLLKPTNLEIHKRRAVGNTGDVGLTTRGGEGDDGETTTWAGEGEGEGCGCCVEGAVEGGCCWGGREGGVMIRGMMETACEKFAGVGCG